MSWIIVGALGLAALVLVFSLFKKLLKLAFTALALLLVIVGIWHYSRKDPEIGDALRQAGEKAGETLEQVTNEALDKASELAREGAKRALEGTEERIEEGADGGEESAADESPDAGNEQDQ